MSRHVRAAAAPCTLVSLCILAGLGGCSRPDWARGADAPPPPKAAAPLAQGPPSSTSVPGMPAWAVGLLGKNPRTVFAKNGVCRGNSDAAHPRATGDPGTEAYGWGWDVAGGRRVERVILVDASYAIAGAGVGGEARPDVPQVYPEIPDKATGWRALTAKTSGPLDAYGVVGGGEAICPLGHLEF